MKCPHCGWDLSAYRPPHVETHVTLCSYDSQQMQAFIDHTTEDQYRDKYTPEDVVVPGEGQRGA